MNCLELNSSFASCLGRESNPHGRFGPRDFRTTMAFATISVCGLDYSFTVELGSLGVSCLVSAPSSFRRLGSRLPSALPVMVSLNLRHSTSLFSESALKLCLSPSCLPFHHQGKKSVPRETERSAKIRIISEYYSAYSVTMFRITFEAASML